jgi:hypothetical protein
MVAGKQPAFSKGTYHNLKLSKIKRNKIKNAIIKAQKTHGLSQSKPQNSITK